MMGKVLAEKENYIGNLENEITEMRKEIEIQREQLLQAAEAQTISVDYKGNNSIYMSLGGGHGASVVNQDSTYKVQPFLNGGAPSSPTYLQNIGFSNLTNQVREAYHSGQLISGMGDSNMSNQAPPPTSSLPGQHAPLRSTSRDRQQPYKDQNLSGNLDAPLRLQAQTVNYSTLTRSLTPLDNITTSGSNNKSGYFHANSGNQNHSSSMNFTNNQTQASATPMLNQTHYEHGRALDNNASYLNANQSSVMMNYQSGLMNHSVATHEKSLLNHTASHIVGGNNTYNGAASGAANSTNQFTAYSGPAASPPGKDNNENSYGYINA